MRGEWRNRGKDAKRVEEPSREKEERKYEGRNVFFGQHVKGKLNEVRAQ
jgi:hypothetical protein